MPAVMHLVRKGCVANCVRYDASSALAFFAETDITEAPLRQQISSIQTWVLSKTRLKRLTTTMSRGHEFRSSTSAGTLRLLVITMLGSAKTFPVGAQEHSGS